MNVPSTSPPKGASRASLVYAGKNKVRYFFNTPRTCFNAHVHETIDFWCLMSLCIYVCILVAPEQLNGLYSCSILRGLFIIGRWWMNINFLAPKCRRPSDASRNINAPKIKMVILSKTAITLLIKFRLLMEKMFLNEAAYVISLGKQRFTFHMRKHVQCDCTDFYVTKLSLTQPIFP
jgi:hypothetical protein